MLGFHTKAPNVDLAQHGDGHLPQAVRVLLAPLFTR